MSGISFYSENEREQAHSSKMVLIFFQKVGPALALPFFIFFFLLPTILRKKFFLLAFKKGVDFPCPDGIVGSHLRGTRFANGRRRRIFSQGCNPLQNAGLSFS
jgi:hypothetical protein